ncbi:MAG: Crp/Fnr family transcriptional regulator [Cyclobacteriaceae bacterium]
MIRTNSNELKSILNNLSEALRNELIEHSKVETFKPGIEILREGQYIKLVPVVISGLIKVFKRYQDKELLLYYIKQNESCVMSFASSIQNGPSQVFAKVEETSEILLIPSDKLAEWRNKYPELNTLFFMQFNARYGDLLETIQHVVFDKLDTRLLKYLTERMEVTKTNPIKISHRQIATELGTSREVISRIIKKLESEKLILQNRQGIEIL